MQNCQNMWYMYVYLWRLQTKKCWSHSNTGGKRSWRPTFTGRCGTQITGKSILQVNSFHQTPKGTLYWLIIQILLPRPFVYRPWWGIWIANAKGSTRLSLYNLQNQLHCLSSLNNSSCGLINWPCGGETWILASDFFSSNCVIFLYAGWVWSIVMIFGFSHLSIYETSLERKDYPPVSTIISNNTMISGLWYICLLGRESRGSIRSIDKIFNKLRQCQLETSISFNQ